MKKGLTEIVCVLDRSGSMSPVQTDVIGNFNNFLDEQVKVPGEANVSLFLFDDKHDTVYKGVRISEVKKLDDTVYFARGWTALLDAVGKAIKEVGGDFASRKEEERPEKVIMLIMTDGCENYSKEYAYHQIKEMIEHQKQNYNWEFVFLGANIDSFAVGGSIGVSARNTMNYTNTSAGVRDAYMSMSNCVSNFRNSGDASIK